MKLNALHLFLILLGSLIFCSILGNPTVEGMSGKSGRPHKDDKLYKIIINEYTTPYPPPTQRNEEQNIQTNTQQQQQLVDSANTNTNTNTNYHSTNYYGSGNSEGDNGFGDSYNDDYENNESYSNDEPEYNTVQGSQIPAGSEDLYVLKSEIVPPVCPACPTNASCPREEPAPPCPPCARCPEPAFDCKKVPNYRVNDDDSLPRPVLADFSQFGM